MTQLGSIYRFGWGVQADVARAKVWYERAAAAGQSQAMNELGGLSGDMAQSRAWYEKAANAGSPVGMGNLAALLTNERAGPVDYPRSASLLLRSAKLDAPLRRKELLASMEKWPAAACEAVKAELTRLGYYIGPIDGQWDAAARSAVSAFLKAES